MEIVKVYFLSGNDEDFKHILVDKSIKKHIEKTTKFLNYIFLEFASNTPDQVISYFVIKYSDYIKDFNQIIPDRTPVMFKDYTPKNYKSVDK